ncbi:RNA-dependent RNA polymerase [Marigold cryptic virus]|nr:RNA-dependent RNA polymerase [Marigold cryptic virus]
MSVSTINISGYQFTSFRGDLEDLHQRHSETIGRQSETIYEDEFAKAELMDIAPQLYDQWIQGWARSYYSGTKHLEAIMQYATPNTPITRLNQLVWRQSVEAVRDGLRSLSPVRAFSVDTELKSVQYIQSSSAGYGYIGAKGEPEGENHRRAIARAKATLYSAIRTDGQGIEHAIKESVPDVGYTRTQLANIAETTKVRGVWGRAFHYILLEGTIAKPLLDSFMTSDTFVMIGRDPTTSVPRLLSSIKTGDGWISSIDWSQFDSTVSRFEIEAAFSLLKEKVYFPDLETEMCFEFCKLLFIHKKIAAPDGKIYWSHKGIPSGSYFTTLIGSIVNRLRIEYLWRIKYNEGPESCYVLGDDSLIYYDRYYDPSEIAREASNLNWYMNPDKTECSTIPSGITFLGRTVKGGMNQRDLKRCLRLLILPEYPVEDGSISAYRAESIAEDAGGTGGILNDIAKRLKRIYGVASEEEVPIRLRRYNFNL